jgi:ATP-dependent Clp protease ATP-binding subunit ClpC
MPQPATQTLTRIFSKAQQQARELNQEFVGVEHLALALLDDDDSEAVRILRQMNVESGYVRNALAHTLPRGAEPPIVDGELPMSPKAQRMVTKSVVSANGDGKDRISSRHLLCSILEEGGGVVCEVLRRSGADSSELARALRDKEVTPEA